MKFSIMITVLVFTLISPVIKAQNSISLNDLYEKISVDYPSAKKQEIEAKIATLNEQIAGANLYPELIISGRVSYQSEVTEFQAGAISPPAISKDQYNISLGLNQVLFDGGRTRSLSELAKISGEISQANLEVEIWNVRRQLDEVYFNTILLQKQLETTNVLLKDLNEQLELVRSRVKNGVLLPGNEYVMQAEILKLKQRKIQINEAIKAGYQVINYITGIEISEQTTLELPEEEGLVNLEIEEIQRPELMMFDAQKKMLGVQDKINSAQKLPQISAFANTAYGRPGYNVFDDDLHVYWMIGLKANWSFKSFRNSDKKSSIVELEQQNVSASEDAFSRQVQSSLAKVRGQISAIEEQIVLDNQVVELRRKVAEEKKNELQQGVITSTEYITELNALSKSQLNLNLHQIQLLQAKNEYKSIKGLSWK
ncbi:TolC family protein [bacterium]|nr:TolC family protein [bacterium]